MTIAIAPKTTLYECDLNLWVEDQITKLKAGDLQKLDIENLIEELEGLAGRDKREVSNRLKRLIEHILKRCYVKLPDCYRGWEITIINQRDELNEILSQSPSLKQVFLQSFDDAFKKALRLVKTEYREVSLPDTWQFGRDIDTMLNVDFWE
jgi:hypothetical protein